VDVQLSEPLGRRRGNGRFRGLDRRRLLLRELFFLLLRRLWVKPLSEKLAIGARGSPLSLAQTGGVARAIASFFPELAIRVVPIKTSGDDPGRGPGAQWGIKGLFVKEIEEALLAGAVDLAVHSAKDLPAELPAGLVLGAVPERIFPGDALVGAPAADLLELPPGARIGTSSLRRMAQIKYLRPDLTVVPLRGNVDTRIAKIGAGLCDAAMLAAAGLIRLKGPDFPFSPMDPALFLPAPGQGLLALETREGDARVAAFLAPLNHPPSALALAAERAFMARLGAGCAIPAGAWARESEGVLRVDGLVADVDGSEAVRRSLSLPRPTLAGARALGESLAALLWEGGGSAIIERAR
jgi:hydroxymethylbilane synthase